LSEGLKKARNRKMIIRKIVVGEMKSNCYIAADAKTKKAFVIDAGGDYEKIKAAIDKNAFRAKSIINTHGHIDHISANRYLNLPVWIHKDDADFLEDSGKNLSSLMGLHLMSPAASRLLAEGDILKAGDVELEVIHTPGHTPGSICLKSDGVLFTGDTLFCAGVGRTDFPYGSQDRLIRSLKDKILRYGDETIVYPGHGPTTTIGKEKKINPFLLTIWKS